MKSCATCYFARKDPRGADNADRICRRYPPKAFPTQVKHPISGEMTMASITVWPPVDIKNDGCGEHKPHLAATNG